MRKVNLRQLVTLLAVIGAGAYLRLWNIQHTFNIIHDYDEGVYALGARAILDGNLPYRDFTLIHPPLYNLVLALGYRLFGYDFLIGRYLSVVLSLGCIVLLYFLGRRLYHSTAGVVAATFFACSGLPVYLGRRGVQDPLGMLLLLGGLLCAVQYLSSKKGRFLILSGLLFGTAIATKYLFLPAVIGAVVATLVCAAPEHVWKQVRRIANLRFWALYAALSISLYALLLLVSRLALPGIAIPLLEPLYPTPANALVVIVVFVLPLPGALLLMGRRLALQHGDIRWPCSATRRRFVLVLSGVAVGFVALVGPFFIGAPGEFLRQTLFLHQQRTVAEVPSFVGLVRVLPVSDISLLLVSIPVLCGIPVIFLLLHRKAFSRSDAFVAVTLGLAFLLCQAFPPMPRYYICIYPLVFLGLSWIVGTPGVALPKRIKHVTCGVMCVLFLAALASTVVVLLRYSPDSSVRDGQMYTPDERAYVQVAASLKDVGAEKVYAVNPVFAALAEDTESSIRVDTFAELFLERSPAREVLEDLGAEGVDYVVLDPWLTYWGDSWIEGCLFADAVRHNSRLVDTIRYGSRDHVEIYELGAAPEPVFNGDFVLWDRFAGFDYPAGWQPVLVDGEGDSAGMEQRHYMGRNCVVLTVFEDGEAEEENTGTHAGIVQWIPFPENRVVVELRCVPATESVGSDARGPAIHFLDGEGHSLTIGFSEGVDEEQTYPCDGCDRMVVMEPYDRGEWASYSLNLRQLWGETSWPEPEELRMLLVVSVDDDHAGKYEFLVADVAWN